jgi:putative endonuclease
MTWVYILRCADNTFYVGHADDLESRLQLHRAGLGARHTALRLPVDLVYKEQCRSKQSAVKREQQLKRWSAKKKAALIRGDFDDLRHLSRCLDRGRRRGNRAEL